MAIPESQLTTWSKQGAVAQSRDTYASVKAVLEDSDSPYYQKSFGTFLQGSYANNTNVYRDSDVDIVIRLDSTWYHDANLLPENQHAAFERAYPGSADYGLKEFKPAVANWLKQNFGNGVRIGQKAIFVPRAGARRDCDVLPCARFKYYWRFTSRDDQEFAEGICFFLRDGTRIENFPKQHRENCTAKHQATGEWFKPTVRVYKNMRNKLVDSGMLADGVAPSYFLEGLLWNVPNEKFGRSFDATFTSTFNFLVGTDPDYFRCANNIHFLLRDGSRVSWPPANYQSYLNALRSLWNNW